MLNITSKEVIAIANFLINNIHIKILTYKYIHMNLNFLFSQKLFGTLLNNGFII